MESRTSGTITVVRILTLNYEHPPLGGGGGRLGAKVASGLVRRGHDVRIVTGGMPHLPKETVEEGVEVRRLRSLRRREDTCSVPEMAAWVLRAIPAAIAETRRWKPDVIHAHFAVPTGAVAWAVHKATGVPYVLTVHLGDVPGGVPEQTGDLFRWVKPFTDPVWRDAAATTAVSSFVAGLAEKAYGIRPRVILNGMPLPPPRQVVRNNAPRLLFVGRMSVQKDPVTAVRALALLKDLPWSCVMIGEGPLAAEVRSEIARAGLEDRIALLGWASSGDVSAAMRESEILLIPSLSEGLPMVAVEALANGLALAGSRIGGLADVLEEGVNGSLFDLAAGPEGFAASLRPMLSDPESLAACRHASLAKARAFDLEPVLGQYEQILAEAAR
jgi:glycosyltransferase involved in cell wall biosynthesis